MYFFLIKYNPLNYQPTNEINSCNVKFVECAYICRTNSVNLAPTKSDDTKISNTSLKGMSLNG